MNDLELINTAQVMVKPMTLSRDDLDAATVASAIKTKQGNIYTGVCISLSCGIGFCAEHAAVAEMIKGGETAIDTIVATGADNVMAPCGRCRELLAQVNKNNLNARVLLDNNRAVELKQLLPEHWM